MVQIIGFRRLDFEDFFPVLPFQFPLEPLQISSQVVSKLFHPSSNLVVANKTHEVRSVQEPDEVGVVPLANHLKSGRIPRKGVIWQSWRGLHFSIVPDVFGCEIWDALFSHVQNTSLLGPQKPLVAPSAVAVTAHVFEVMFESAPTLGSVNVNMDSGVFLVDT